MGGRARVEDPVVTVVVPTDAEVLGAARSMISRISPFRGGSPVWTGPRRFRLQRSVRITSSSSSTLAAGSSRGNPERTGHNVPSIRPAPGTAPIARFVSRSVL